jgi:hypothetical protein
MRKTDSIKKLRKQTMRPHKKVATSFDNSIIGDRTRAGLDGSTFSKHSFCLRNVLAHSLFLQFLLYRNKTGYSIQNNIIKMTKEATFKVETPEKERINLSF